MTAFRVASALLLLSSSLFATTFCYHHENVLGTSLELRLDAASESAATAAERRVLTEVDRLAQVLSTYLADSEISRWLAQQRGEVTVSPDLLAVLKACDAWEAASGGAFNPRVESISQVWRAAENEGRLPHGLEVQTAVKRASVPGWRVTPDGRAERLGDCPVSVSALAKGYIIQKAAARAMEPESGVISVLLNIGGDLAVLGEAGQQVAIADPRADAENAPPIAQVQVRAAALATSGSYRRGTRNGAGHHSHIFHPKTGQPADEVLSASVVAPDATSADALATIFSVLSPQESLFMADSLKGVSCLLVTPTAIWRSQAWRDTPFAVQTALPEKKELPLSGGSGVDLVPMRQWTNTDGKTIDAAVISLTGKTVKFRLKSGGTSEYQSSKLQEADRKVIEEAAAAGWGAHHELVVNYEINTPSGGRAKRPYVAIWLEDKDGFPVRTLALLMQGGKGMRWLPDLKKWSRSDKLRRLAEDSDLVPTISSATRNPGSYSVLWDGLDNSKTPVKPGTYTLFIEAAREHGTYQLMKKEISVGGGSPFSEKLSGNEEIKGATLDYRAKAAK